MSPITQQSISGLGNSRTTTSRPSFNNPRLNPRPTAPRRFRKLAKDNINSITKPSLRRLARRGGVRRIKTEVYGTIKDALVTKLREIIRRIVFILEGSGPQTSTGRKTITTLDVVFVLRQMGETLLI